MRLMMVDGEVNPWCVLSPRHQLKLVSSVHSMMTSIDKRLARPRKTRLRPAFVVQIPRVYSIFYSLHLEVVFWKRNKKPIARLGSLVTKPDPGPAQVSHGPAAQANRCI